LILEAVAEQFVSAIRQGNDMSSITDIVDMPVKVYVTSKTYASLQRESKKTGKDILQLVSKLAGRKVSRVVVSDD
jgi:hypothetical protein